MPLFAEKIHKQNTFQYERLHDTKRESYRGKGQGGD